MRNPVDRLTAGLPNGWRVAIDWVVTIVGAVLVVLAIKLWIVNPYRIPSASMEPTLHCGDRSSGCQASHADRVLACRICYELGSPKRGDIVVFNTPPAAAQRCGEGGVFVKRLVGLPGDVVREDGQGFISIDGRKLEEAYIQPSRRDADARNNAQFRNRAWRVPAGEYFFMGDNRPSSCDSRVWGSVPRGNLIGKVVATYWPPGRVSLGV